MWHSVSHTPHTITWRKLRQSNTCQRPSELCNLCLDEKMEILLSQVKPPTQLNRRFRCQLAVTCVRLRLSLLFWNLWKPNPTVLCTCLKIIVVTTCESKYIYHNAWQCNVWRFQRIGFNNVLVNKFYYYNYNTTKIFDDPVAFLSGTIYHNALNIVPLRKATGSSKIWLFYNCNNKICWPRHRWIIISVFMHSSTRGILQRYTNMI